MHLYGEDVGGERDETGEVTRVVQTYRTFLSHVTTLSL